MQAEQRNGQNAGKEVPYASRNQVTLDGSYDWHGTTFTLASYYFSKSYSDAANTVDENSTGSMGQIPSYWVWNAQISRDLYKSNTMQTVMLGLTIFLTATTGSSVSIPARGVASLHRIVRSLWVSA